MHGMPWLLSATNAVADAQLYVVPERRITPTQVTAIATALDAVLTEHKGQRVTVLTYVIGAQTRYARELAASAAKSVSARGAVPARNQQGQGLDARRLEHGHLGWGRTAWSPRICRA